MEINGLCLSLFGYRIGKVLAHVYTWLKSIPYWGPHGIYSHQIFNTSTYLIPILAVLSWVSTPFLHMEFSSGKNLNWHLHAWFGTSSYNLTVSCVMQLMKSIVNTVIFCEVKKNTLSSMSSTLCCFFCFCRRWYVIHRHTVIPLVGDDMSYIYRISV